MRWFRRHPHPHPQPTAATATTTDVVLAPRVERALVSLAVQAQQIEDRLARLERRVDEQREATLDLPTHADILDVRLHSAKVAAELTRVTVELRAEIERAAATATTTTTSATQHDRRILALAEQIIDLSDGSETLVSDVAAHDDEGWAATA